MARRSCYSLESNAVKRKLKKFWDNIVQVSNHSVSFDPSWFGIVWRVGEQKHIGLLSFQVLKTKTMNFRNI